MTVATPAGPEAADEAPFGEAPVRPRRRVAVWVALAIGLLMALLVGVLATRPSAESTLARSPLLGKPAPDLFLHASERMGVAPARCVVVEDSRSGVEAARAAGMRVLAFAGGLSPVPILDGPNTIVFDDMRELPGLLGAPYGEE